MNNPHNHISVLFIRYLLVIYKQDEKIIRKKDESILPNTLQGFVICLSLNIMFEIPALCRRSQFQTFPKRKQRKVLKKCLKSVSSSVSPQYLFWWTVSAKNPFLFETKNNCVSTMHNAHMSKSSVVLKCYNAAAS